MIKNTNKQQEELNELKSSEILEKFTSSEEIENGISKNIHTNYSNSNLQINLKLQERHSQNENQTLQSTINNCSMEKKNLLKQLSNIPKHKQTLSNKQTGSDTTSSHSSFHLSHIKLLNNNDTFNSSEICSFSKKSFPNETHPKETLFSEVETLRLKLYFKHICLQYCTAPKNTTFSHVEDIFSSIGLPEWMIYCKIFKFTEKFKLFCIGIKKLSDLFKKYENIERRVTFDNFVFLVNEVILELLRNPKFTTENDEKETLKRLFETMKIDSKESQICKLKEMGINISEEDYNLPKERKTIYGKSKFLNDSRISRVTNQEKISRSEHINSKVSHTLEYQKTKTNDPSNRKLLKPLKKITILNMKKMKINCKDLENIFMKTNEKEDKYLKEYLGSEERIKNGILKKLSNLNLKKKAKVQI